jgi:hypothetical protein
MKYKTTENERKTIVSMYNTGISISNIKSQFNICRGTVVRIAKNGGCNLRHKIVNNIKKDFLIDTTNKINCYLLGLLWADGYIYSKSYKQSPKCYGQKLTLTLTKKDFDVIEKYIRNNGINTIYERQEIRNGKNFGKIQKTFTIHNKNIVDFLLENDYKLKSSATPSKILNKIPENFKNYFWRGYFDGDGYIRATTKMREMSICSTIEQDWKEAIELFNSLGIKNYKIKKYIRRNGKCKYSMIKVGSVNDITLLGTYLYQNYDGIGFNRKYNRYLDFLKIVPTLQQSKIK